MFAEQNYSAAYDIYSKLGNFEDAPEKAKECLYIQATALRAEKKWDEANALFEQIKDYKDSAELIHLHNYEVTASENATCVKDGYKDFKCGGCGQTYREDLKATGKHDYKVVNSKNATCEAGGFKDYKCSTCDHSYRDDIKATGHNYSSATCTEAKKCKTCGQTSGSALGHSTGGTKCSRCGTVTFKTLTYSGSGFKTIRNITVPSGNFVVTGKASSIDGKWGGSFYVYLKYSNGDNAAYWIESLFSDKLSLEKMQPFNGPLNGGYLEINADDNVRWTITIEAVG